MLAVYNGRSGPYRGVFLISGKVYFINVVDCCDCTDYDYRPDMNPPLHCASEKRILLSIETGSGRKVLCPYTEKGLREIWMPVEPIGWEVLYGC